MDLTKHTAAGKRLDIVVITTPCVHVSARGRGLAQQGQVCPKPLAYECCSIHMRLRIKSRPFKHQMCVQASNLIFTAIDKIKQYAKVAGRLPVIVSENVAGMRYRRWDETQVSTSIATAVAAAILYCHADLLDLLILGQSL
jgi:hypothetical protein